MSFATSLAVPASVLSYARNLLRGGSLRSMVNAVGVVVGAGMLAAGYQIAYEEGRQIIGNLRNNAAARRARNDAVVLTLMSTELPLRAQDSIRRSRDALRTAMKLVTDERTPENYRLIIREALGRLVKNQPSS